MRKAVSGIYLRPVLAGLVGLGIGVLCQKGVTQGDLSTSSGAASHQPGSKRTAKTDAPKADSPTTRFLREASGLTAEECEQRVLELKNSKVAGLELEMEAIFRRWMSLETPEKVLASLKEIKEPWREDWNRALFRAWVALDEQGAMGSTTSREFAMERAMHAIGNADPSVARYLRDVSGVFTESPLYRTALPWLAREHPELAKAAGPELPESIKKNGLAAIAAGLASRDPRGALAWLESLGMAASPGPVDSLIQEWAKTDPQAAEAARSAAPKGEEGTTLRRVPPNVDQRSASYQLQLGLSRDPFLDVEGLYRQLAEADIDWSKPSAMPIAINHDSWYSADPAAAAREAEKLPPGQARDYLLLGICQTWAAHDEEAAKQFAEQHQLKIFIASESPETPTAEMREAVSTAPEQALSGLSDPASVDRNGTSFRQLCNLAAEWAARDPEAASRWLIEQNLPMGYNEPGGAEASTLFSNTLGYYWAGEDPVGASDWVASLPDGPMKSRAWGAIHENVARYSPDLAFNMSVAYYSPGEARLRVLGSDLKEVQKAGGHEAAQALLDASSLSPQERATLAEGLRNQSSK